MDHFVNGDRQTLDNRLVQNPIATQIHWYLLPQRVFKAPVFGLVLQSCYNTATNTDTLILIFFTGFYTAITESQFNFYMEGAWKIPAQFYRHFNLLTSVG